MCEDIVKAIITYIVLTISSSFNLQRKFKVTNFIIVFYTDIKERVFTMFIINLKLKHVMYNEIIVYDNHEVTS